jgi:anti-sigma factor RsiW
MLDGLLDDQETQLLKQDLLDDPAQADNWDRLVAVDAMLKNAPMAPPPVDFTAMVMAKVDAYESRRRWTPWLVGTLAVLSIVAALSIALPVVFFTTGLYSVVLELIALNTTVMSALDAVVTAASWILMRAENWLTLLSQEPAALATVISALVMASIVIGLREGQRALALSTVEARVN